MGKELNGASDRKMSRQAFAKAMKPFVAVALLVGIMHGFFFRWIAGTRVGVVGGIIVGYLVLEAGWVFYGIQLIADIQRTQNEIFDTHIHRSGCFVRIDQC